MLYQRGLEDKGKVGAGDLNNCFMAMGGDCRDASKGCGGQGARDDAGGLDLVRVLAHSRLAHPRRLCAITAALPRAQTPTR